MHSHELSPDTLLTTTRSVRRRLDLDRPVPLDLIHQCVEIALQAPTGGNSQGGHFVVVTDPAKRAGIAELYRRSWAGYRKAPGSVYDRYTKGAGRAAEGTDASRRPCRPISSSTTCTACRCT